MPVEIRWRKVSYFDGTPYARKLARTVWSGGKGRDNIKTLPIAIVSLLQDAQCIGYLTDRFPESLRSAYEDTVSE